MIEKRDESADRSSDMAAGQVMAVELLGKYGRVYDQLTCLEALIAISTATVLVTALWVGVCW